WRTLKRYSTTPVLKTSTGAVLQHMLVRDCGLVAVVIRFIRTSNVNTQVFSLRLGQLCQPHTQGVEVQTCHLLIKQFRQHVHANLVGFTGNSTGTAFGGEQFDLCDDLVGERSRHHKRRVTGGVTQVQQAPLRKYDDRTLLVGALIKDPLVNLWFNFNLLNAGNLAQAGHIDFVIKVANVTDDCLILHGQHVLGHDDVATTGSSDAEIGGTNDVVQTSNLVTIHGGLQCDDRINLGDNHTSALTGEGISSTLANITVTSDDGGFATDQNVGTAHNAVRQ